MQLVRITNQDYRDYRRSYAKIEYSFSLKGERQFTISKEMKRLTDASILKKGEFLDMIEMPQFELYFIKNEQDEIIGITTLTVEPKRAIIDMFAVFEKEQGIGKEAFVLVKDLLKSKGVRLVRLICPFDGAKEFWKKQGFYNINGSTTSFEAMLPK
jgi:hypothetical protein